MVQIAEDYVSPSVRWGVLKQDYPEAIAEFSSCTGAEIGIPEKFGGVEEYCVAQILLRPTDEMPIIGYKPFSDAKQNKNDHASDAWNTLCTKALGRALKRAGYADTASEMKLVVTYKQRLAEHDAIRTGDDQTISEEPPIPDTETKRNSVDSSESSQVIADNFGFSMVAVFSFLTGILALSSFICTSICQSLKYTSCPLNLVESLPSNSIEYSNNSSPFLP